MLERLEQYLLRRKINTVVDRKRPIIDRHIAADIITIFGNKQNVELLDQKLKLLRNQVPREDRHERIFIWSSRGSARWRINHLNKS